MRDTVLQFYEELAEVYHLQYEDWEGAIRRQSEVIDKLLRAKGLGSGQRILDCTCGIGTQALGLAALGHQVTGSDLSAAAVKRASREAQQRGLALEVAVADVRSLREVPGDGFDVVISMDNALPHLALEELPVAVEAIAAKLRPGGVFMASTRDYDQLVRERPVVQGPAFYGERGERRIVHQVWEWIDGYTYVPHMYITREVAGRWQTHHVAAVYHCLQRAEFSQVLEDAGLVEVRWLMAEESGYYQPIVLAKRALQPEHTDDG